MKTWDNVTGYLKNPVLVLNSVCGVLIAVFFVTSIVTSHWLIFLTSIALAFLFFLHIGSEVMRANFNYMGSPKNKRIKAYWELAWRHKKMAVSLAKHATQLMLDGNDVGMARTREKITHHVWMCQRARYKLRKLEGRS